MPLSGVASSARQDTGNQSQHECLHIPRNPTVTNSTDRRISSQGLVNLIVLSSIVGVCVGASTLVHRTPPKEHGFRPRGRLWGPIYALHPPARVQSRFEFVELARDMSSNCTGEVQARTGITGWYQVSVPRQGYK